VQIRRSATGVEVLAPAKINLFFEVLNRRNDGFHEIETLMVPISLYDTLFLEDDENGTFSLTAHWSKGIELKQRETARQTGAVPEAELNLLPQGDDNHALRAVRQLAADAGIVRGAKLRLVKRIPAAAGLGGGSSDAAAALVAANLVWKLNWPREKLEEVAAKIGSDVPFFIASRPAVCRGRGEQIDPIPRLPAMQLVVVRPPEGLSTPAVYRACRPGSPPKTIEPVLAAFRSGSPEKLGNLLHNRLLEPARSLSPWIDSTLEQLNKEKPLAIGMSGSGTTCFALCRSAFDARRCAARLKCRRPGIGQIWSVMTV
jgi:4-diphosphocytidyl-2-C-methyl-D-erythritol kinase